MREQAERGAPGPGREVVLPGPRSRPDADPQRTGFPGPGATGTERPGTGVLGPIPAQATRRTRRGTGVEELRIRIAALVEALHEIQQEGLQLDEARWRIDELAQEINRPYPSPPRVRSRWLRLAPLLRELDPALPVTGTAQLIEAAF